MTKKAVPKNAGKPKTGGYLVATLEKFPGVRIPLLSDEECRARGIEPGRLPSVELWSPEQQNALRGLAALFAEIAVRDVLAEQTGGTAAPSESVTVDKFASAADIADFTGEKTARTQARALKAYGARFAQRADGAIALRREELERVRASMREVVDRMERQRSETQHAAELAAAATFMNHEEIAALTGFRRPKRQAMWLAERRYRFEVRGDGRIALQRAEVDAHTLSRPRRERPRMEPNWGALDLKPSSRETARRR